MNSNNNTPTPSKEWMELYNRFVELCNKEERLFRKEFNDVWDALFEIDKEQKAIYYAGGDFGITLPAKADKELLYKALTKAGYANDEAFCKDFIEYANNKIEGKKIIQQGTYLNYYEVIQQKEKTQRKQVKTDEWLFVSLNIIAPPELHPIINKKLENDAKEFKGLFGNFTTIPFEDVSEDDFAMVDVYDCKATFTTYLDELKRFKIIPRKENDAFLPQDFKQFLFQILKDHAIYVKEHTDKPAQTKNYILEKIKLFDKIPIFGLIFQILILQGLCRWMESVNISKGDKGFNEAQSFYNWLFLVLCEKLVHFCFFPFGDEDRKKLKPLCDYLYTTEAGQYVQQRLFGDTKTATGEPKHPDNGIVLPDELNTPKAKEMVFTERAKKYFAKAIKAGFMEQMGDHYKWLHGSNVALSYFIHEIYYLKDGFIDPPYKEFENLFGVKNLSQSYHQYSFENHKTKRKWKPGIDGLFDD